MTAFITARHAVGIVGSLGLHGAALVTLTLAPLATGQPLPPSTVEFEVPPPPPATPAPPPPPRPEPEPEPVAPATAPAAPEPAEVDPPQATEPELVDLSGVTLTDDGSGDGWTSVVGNGSSRTAPIRHPRRQASAPPRSAPGVEPASLHRVVPPPPPPPVVPVADLARRPSPPSLDGVLQANYPPEARRRGEGGRAVVVARIEADGVVRSARILSATAPEFGAACQRTVVGSCWDPPRNRGGKKVATEVSYTCRFEVAR
ncbi:MAG: TonB family protein [Polyangiaceae bacterium]|nr:TonB family protein [Polyangiaceae bacterium]